MNIVSITIATVILSSFIVQKADFLPINDSCQTSQLLSFKPCPRWLNPRHTEHDYPIELQCYVSPDNTTVTWRKNGNQIMGDKQYPFIFINFSVTKGVFVVVIVW